MTETNSQVPGTHQVQVQVREDKMTIVFSNVSGVRFSPNAEDFILDIGVIQQDPTKADGMIMDLSTRVFMSAFAAKKLALALSQTVQRYEQQFGSIELDPRRRLKQPQ
jgi:hypothetical protein